MAIIEDILCPECSGILLSVDRSELVNPIELALECPHCRQQVNIVVKPENKGDLPSAGITRPSETK